MPPSDSQVLASYTERLPQVRRDFSLFADRIEVRARWALGRRTTTTVRLANLAPKTTTLLIRNRLVKRGITLGALSIAAGFFFSRPGLDPWMQSVAPAGWTVGIICLAVAAMTFRKTPFVRFCRRDGRPGLDIARAGPHTQAFPGFVDEVRRRIRQQQ